MALYKDGKLYGSISTFNLSKKLEYIEVKDSDKLYSLHINKKGEWMCQCFKWWLQNGATRMSLQDTLYNVNDADPFVVREIKPKVEGLVYPGSDDDIPF